MTEKQKIISIYVSVAVIAAILLTGFMWLGKLRREQSAENARKHHPIVQVEETIQALTPLDKQVTANLVGTNQDGEQVDLYSLKGKVVVFAQFYSRCNECLGFNKSIMQELHEEFKDNPKVQFVTVTLDPEFDTPEKLKETAKVWGAGTDSWWMVNVPKDKLVKFCREQLWYVDFKENENKTGASDAINHDMGIAVIDAETKLRVKVDLFTLLSNGHEDLYQVRKSQLVDMVNSAVAEAE